MSRIRLPGVLALLLVPAAFPSMASANSLEAVPTSCRLENYISNHTVKLWYTPAAECTNGGIEVGSMSQDDHNRLWSLILDLEDRQPPGRDLLKCEGRQLHHDQLLRSVSADS